MNATRVIWMSLAASLVVPTTTAVAIAESVEDSSGQTVADMVRRATDRFQDIQAALEAGYIQNGGCVSGPEEGAMGVHFAKPELFDGELELEKPEVLVYEPRNGRLRLVAVEYVTPYLAWQAANMSQPHVGGQLFHYVSGPNRYGGDAFYELHVWAWKQNPKGTFSDWNPRVSCDEYTGEPTVSSHAGH